LIKWIHSWHPIIPNPPINLEISALKARNLAVSTMI
jgi:hypothetical protein